MIHIGILILKTIGILLLVLFIIIIAMLLLILFVPIRYEIKSEKNDALYARARVHWLLHIISAEYNYEEAGAYFVKIMGIRIIDSNKSNVNSNHKKKKASKSKRKADEINNDISQINSNTNDNGEPAITAGVEIIDNTNKKIENSRSIDNRNESKNSVGGNTETIKNEDKKNNDKKSNVKKHRNKKHRSIKNKDKNIFKKITNWIQHLVTKIQYTIKSICDKIKKTWNDIQYFKSILSNPNLKPAVLVAWKQIKKILNSIKPRKFKIHMQIGTQDPSTLGEIMAWYGIFYPIYTYHIQIYPDFEREVFLYSAFLKGRIRVFTILKVLFILYFDKHIREIIALLKREEK